MFLIREQSCLKINGKVPISGEDSWILLIFVQYNYAENLREITAFQELKRKEKEMRKQLCCWRDPRWYNWSKFSCLNVVIFSIITIASSCFHWGEVTWDFSSSNGSLTHKWPELLKLPYSHVSALGESRYSWHNLVRHKIFKVYMCVHAHGEQRTAVYKEEIVFSTEECMYTAVGNAAVFWCLVLFSALSTEVAVIKWLQGADSYKEANLLHLP